jgi:hypothetical protein
MNANEENKTSGIPQSSASKPMDSKRDVESSPDPKTEQDFPGYPHYPSKENNMGEDSGQHRVDAKLEESITGPNASGVDQRFRSGNAQSSEASQAEGSSTDLAALDGKNDEIGVRQNVSDEDLNVNKATSG